ncbi:MAG TPA: hypothetical protein VFQ43_17870 [Nitrososphaera sp.]|nr:hypothetical protein [Nitrososphaera sp.]
MKKSKLATMRYKRLKIRPVARRFDYSHGELPPIDDAWLVTDASPHELSLCNPRTSHQLRIGTDHVREFMTDPKGSDGLLILKSQVSLRGNGIDVEPLL